ncbi:MAG: hypothetical protein ABFD08_10800 [Syntrophomonas sp.]
MSIKADLDKRILVFLALMGAITAAYFKGNALAYLGILYYSICAIAVLFNYHRTNLLLWGAVAVHCVLVGYILWNWTFSSIVPCRYCMTAAGFALLAAITWQKKSLAVLPVILMLVVWYWWPTIFYHTPRQVYNEIFNNAAVQSVSDCGCDE